MHDMLNISGTESNAVQTPQTIKFEASPETQPAGIYTTSPAFLPALGAKQGRRVSSFTQEKDGSGARVGSEDRARAWTTRLKAAGCAAVERSRYVPQ